MKYCRRVIGRQHGQPVFCNGNLISQSYKDIVKNKIFKQIICQRCGRPSTLDPEEIKFPSEKIQESFSGI